MENRLVGAGLGMVGGEGCVVAKMGSKREISAVMKLCCILPVTQIYIWDNMTKKYMYISYQDRFPDCAIVT